MQNREYPGNFQNETVISKLFFKRSTQIKWEGRPFWSGQEAQIYLLNYLLPTYRGNVNYYKSVHYTLLTLPMETGSTLAILKINQETLLSIAFLDIFSSCPNWRGNKGLFWKGARKGTTLQDYHLVDIGDEKVSFCEISNNPTPPLFFTRLPLQIRTAGKGILWKNYW